MKRYYNSSLFVLLVATLFFASCQYDFEVKPAPEPPPDPGDTLSFSAEIIPIFAAKCVACHGGSQDPDLRADNAYNSIQTLSLVNLAVPADSEIYTWPNPTNTTKHAWKKYSAAEAAKVLFWIEQGALNN